MPSGGAITITLLLVVSLFEKKIVLVRCENAEFKNPEKRKKKKVRCFVEIIVVAVLRRNYLVMMNAYFDLLLFCIHMSANFISIGDIN